MFTNLFLNLMLISTTLGLKRISELKCEEYKEKIKTETCVGYSVFTKCPTRLIHYECNKVGHTGLIVGGKAATTGEFPHMAAIGWKTANGTIGFQCGGSLISERFVLTAAHCESHPDLGAPSVVRLGVQNLANSGIESAPVELKIVRMIIHPEYDSIDKENDIALIELEKDITFHDRYLRPACLQQTEYSGPNVTATGWGKNSTYGTTLDTLMKVTLPTKNILVCEEKLDSTSLSSDRQICAGGEGFKDTCEGDSGAPIQVSHSNAPCVYDVIGLTSFGAPKCGKGKNTPAIYTKTFYYLDWIEGIVWPETVTTTTSTTTPKPAARYFLRSSWI